MWITPSNLKSSYNQHLSPDQCAESASKVLFDFGKEAGVNVWKSKVWGGWLTFLDPSVYDPFLEEYAEPIKSVLDFVELQEIKGFNASIAYYDLPFLSGSTTQTGYYLNMSKDMFLREIEAEYVSPVPKGWLTVIVSDYHDLRMNKPLPEYLPRYSLEDRNTVTKLARQMFWVSKLYKTHEVNPRWIEALMGLPFNWVRPRSKSL